MSDDAPPVDQQRIDALPGNDVWTPKYRAPAGMKARHEHAFRVRAGRIGAMAMCICTWPLDIDPNTTTGHSEFCPTEQSSKGAP